MAPATRGEQRALLAAGTVLVAGLFSDGWAHSNRFDELESFVTPYHVVIFVGFLLAGAAVLRVVLTRRAGASSYWDAAPPGYRLAFAGLFAFGAGFLGDGVWHTVFGLESDIDALLSPTHLLMAAALVMLLSAPVRAWDAERRAGATGTRLPGVVSASAGMVTLVVAFFALYTWIPGTSLGTGDLHTWLLTGGEVGQTGIELSQMATLAGGFVVTGILVGAIVELLRRGTPRPGVLGTVVLGVPVAMSAVGEFDRPVTLLAFVAGAAVVELLTHHRALSGAPLWVTTTAWAAVTWSAYWTLLTTITELPWEVELYPGQVLSATALAWYLGSRSERPDRTPA